MRCYMYMNGINNLLIFYTVAFSFLFEDNFARDVWRVDEQMGLMNSMQNRMPNESRHYEHHIHNFWSSKERRTFFMKLEQEVDHLVSFFQSSSTFETLDSQIIKIGLSTLGTSSVVV